MIERFVRDKNTRLRLLAGGLGRYVEGFATLLCEQGYRPKSVTYRIRMVGAFAKWLHIRGVEVRSIDDETVSQFLQYRWKRRSRNRADEPGLRLFLEYLRKRSIVQQYRPQPDKSRLALILQGYAQYLVHERSLAVATRQNYGSLIHGFLMDRFGARIPELGKLRARDITSYLERYRIKFSIGRSKLLVTALRSFLRYAFIKGMIRYDLMPSVPTVAHWKRSGLPKAIPQDHVELILKSCDRRTREGLRDYAILLILARLGLRCHEVVYMRLEDLDWDQGEVIIRGKGCRSDRLPVPEDVGAAIATYLRRGRPQCADRRLFVRVKAPHKGFSGSCAVGDLLRRAAVRAGFKPSLISPHRLRHSVATEMLRQGATLQEISQLLRHRQADTTTIYAKVDVIALRRLAQPWPRATR